MRNNINGDFSKVEKISELKPGAFININWNKKKLMLPYTLRKDYISFTDKKWDWRYKFNPKYILSSTIGGDAKYSGFLNNFISVQDYEEELDCNLIDLKSMQSIMI